MRRAKRTFIFVCTLLLYFLPNTFICAQPAVSQTNLSSNPDTIAVPVKDIRRFATVIAQIKKYYIEELDDKTLFDNAIRGMLTNLDPHSDYLDLHSLEDLKHITTGKFGGVGIEVVPDNGLIKVISPLDDSPAQEAGIKAGDMIIRVDNKLVKDMTTREALETIRGKKGTKVTLTILREGEKGQLKFKLTRDVVKIQTVKSKLLEKGYGYIRIAFFQGPAQKQLKEKVKELQKESGGRLKGLVLDLRNNPGGLLDSAIEVTDAFLDANTLKDDKLIVYTKGRIEGADVKAEATKGEILKGVPVIVLINEGSASASEIVAGALQDHNRAVILGTHSFGKGSVQTVIPIDRESGIKLTTALYYTPKGRSIQAEGIKPDVLVTNLKLPDGESKAVLFDPILESDLTGHIENKKTKSSKGDKIDAKDLKPNEGEKKLAHSDYQLYEALMLLKGLNATKY